MEIGRDYIALLHEAAGKHILARAALMHGQEKFLAEELLDLLRHAVIARAAGVGVIGKIIRAGLPVAHGVAAGVGEHIDENVLGLKII